MGPYFRWMPDAILPYQNGQTVSNYVKDLFIHPDIETGYIVVSIREQLNRFAFALATTRNGDGFSMTATTFL